MYRLTNLTLDTTTTYKNKDLVYQALERENAKIKHHEAESMLLVEELDKKGVVIYQEDIHLPFDGIADSLFLQAGTNTAENPSKTKGFSFLKPSEKTIDQEFTLRENQEFRKPFSDTTLGTDRRKRVSFLWQGFMFVGLVASIAMAGSMTSLALKQGKELNSLNQQIKKLETLQAETGKLDAFVRYFLPRYYSEQGLLDDFVAPSLKLVNQTGQLQSVIMESSSQTAPKVYQMTYVLSIKDGENRSQKRLIVTVKVASSSPYGYQITDEPKLADYPS
ncbi:MULTISPECIES: hypothetical protein [unclassified Streptococcus]|uniref:hypothetical protein n=1 Tax=unclassified Streptococcus TaxID=2608887 RepID=UPI001071EC60|nr:MULTISPECIES: hypothetical protein [unclassified Streptococcus]MBF0786672.1 hypothetical protein [Streptococcus sp. 19428wC2_LYSM12]MCQ9211705.1 hypothetical protein [Streptococcus sp. B01]MCQ9213106.1 hypothetical protein [Streptococcus sp. O1]TFV06424.1 hypothetical protein E4T79_01865 [Streptococcus sp. LYSM12]